MERILVSLLYTAVAVPLADVVTGGTTLAPFKVAANLVLGSGGGSLSFLQLTNTSKKMMTSEKFAFMHKGLIRRKIAINAAKDKCGKL